MKTRELSTEDLLKYFLEHVRYEIQMLLNATMAIKNKLRVPNGIENMPVESFAIHLRNLITFLYPEIIRGTDVCAKDFFIAEKEWDGIRPELSEILKRAKTRADKEVGHLTTLRQSGTSETKIWDVVRLTKEIITILKLFCESTNKIGLESYFKEIYEFYLKNF